MTLELPWKIATLVVTAPISIRAKPSQAQRGAASRHLSNVDEAK